MADPRLGDSPVEGLYERLITKAVREDLERLEDRGWTVHRLPVGGESAAHVLADHVSGRVRDLLARLPPDRQVHLANRILAAVEEAGAPADPVDAVRVEEKERPAQLLALRRKGGLGEYAHRPATPLTEAALLTNRPKEPRLGSEIGRELATADRVDLLCAFVRWSGLRLLDEPLRHARRRGAPLRVLTTTYLGATERRALDHLVREHGAQVRVNYEQSSTRLHAKAWLFHRGTGYSTAYVGSSNLSSAALLDGLEWNVRLSAHATPDVLAKFELTFDAYWESDAFEDYDPDRDGDRLDTALERAGAPRPADGQPVGLLRLDVHPYPHQRDMLERLETARTVHGRHRNLLVAATGTGKTVMAALDYKRLRELHGPDLSLLFVAHRGEILDQSLQTYRYVLNDHGFGDLFTGKEKPNRRTHLFASVQTLSRYRHLRGFAPDHFDVVVFDEFHHGKADTYTRIVEYFSPREFLGLTATPERADGTNVQDLYFAGLITAELRLWEALENELLSPFHYFGVSDNTDMRAVAWKRGGYDLDGLDRVLTGNHSRARLVLTAVRDKVADPHRMRALGFCVSVAHAAFMAHCFNEAGIRAAHLHGGSTSDERRRTLQDLREGRVQAVFSVDLLNEGVDIPDADTLLLLRPTSSATVFLQQLGRGLRRTPDKAVLTVLDFIGQHRAEFRFEEQFRAITGQGRKRLYEAVEQDFPRLPSGCHILLEHKAKETVLANLRTQLGLDVRQLAREVRDYGTASLAEYLEESGRRIEEVYRGGRSWTGILRRAGMLEGGAPEGEDRLLKRVAALLHVDDPRRRDHYRMMLDDDAPRYEDLDEQGRAYARMLFFSLWEDRGSGFTHIQQGFDELRRHPRVRQELCQVLDHGIARSEHVPRPLLNGLAGIPLSVHASYSRAEALAALGQARLARGGDRGFYPATFQEGVKWCPEIRTDALFVTVEKDERDFSPKTRYKDVALSEELFHWESQHRISGSTPVGQRYQNHVRDGSQVLLFVRPHKYTDIGRPHPSILLGPVSYVSHRGDRPMGIVWRLKHPIPADVWAYAAAADTG